MKLVDINVNIEAEKDVDKLYVSNTYAKLHNEGVNNASNDRYKIECIPRVFEKILETDQYVSKGFKKIILNLLRISVNKYSG